MGTRAHDLPKVPREDQARFTREELKRLVLGKIVWDLIRGIDYLETRGEVDPARIGIMGNSLGGASASCLSAVEPRVRAAVISGWGHSPLAFKSKACTTMPYVAFAERMSFAELNALSAPHAAMLYINGTKDAIIDPAENGAALVRHIRAGLAGARQILEDAGITGTLESQFVPEADHRPFILTAAAVAWFQEHLMTAAERRPVPEATVHYGTWVEAQGQRLETLYDTEARQRGLAAVDIGAVWYAPKELACFPEAKPSADYTFAGWMERQIARNTDAPALPKPFE